MAKFIVDAFDAGEAYGLVLEWTSLKGKEGEFPNRSIGVPKHFFDVVTDPNSQFELVFRPHVDFDKLIPGERTELDSGEIWKNPDNLFHPRPKDEDGG